MKTSRFLLVAATSLLVSGCGSSTIFKRADLSEGSTFVDARQRAIVSAKLPTGMSDAFKGSSHNRNYMVCAEPSPDVFSTISSSIIGSGSFAQVDKDIALQYATSVAESGLDIGLRTQTIQVLRDMMYRLCERYMNGAISPIEFQQQAARDQRLIVSVLAIEQLTGAVRPQRAGIESTTSVERGKDLLKAQEMLKEAIQAKGVKEKELNALKEANAPLAEAVQTNTATLEAAKVDVKAKEDAVKPLEEVVTASNAAAAETTKKYDAAKVLSEKKEATPEQKAATEKLLAEKKKADQKVTDDNKKVTTAKNALATANTALTAAQTKVTESTNTAAESTKAVEAAEKLLQEAISNVATAQGIRDAADSIASSAGGTITFQDSGNAGQSLDKASIEALSGAVNQIVESTFDDDEFARTCLGLYREGTLNLANEVQNVNPKKASFADQLKKLNEDFGSQFKDNAQFQSMLQNIDNLGKIGTPETTCYDYLNERAQEREKIKKLEILVNLSEKNTLSEETIKLILQ